MGRRYVLFHTSNLWDLVRPYDARTWGENIAYADTLRRVEQLWMQSYHHRVNLLNPSFRSAGIGVARPKAGSGSRFSSTASIAAGAWATEPSRQ